MTDELRKLITFANAYAIRPNNRCVQVQIRYKETDQREIFDVHLHDNLPIGILPDIGNTRNGKTVLECEFIEK